MMEFARSSNEGRKEQIADLPQEEREKVLGKLESIKNTSRNSAQDINKKSELFEDYHPGKCLIPNCPCSDQSLS